MKKIVTVVGARPQFVKAAPVSRVLREMFREVLVHTGQHYDHNMAGIFFDELKIPKPDYNLGIGSGPHGKQTGEMLKKIEEVLLNEKPDAVLVYGDTNSTLAGSLTAGKMHIPVIHVEAGLRSFNKKMPEELNRILTDHMSSLLFTPTDAAVKNLSNEGITNDVINVGDVMYDAVLYNTRIAERKYEIEQIAGIQENNYILATVHRAENTDDYDRLKAIFESLDSLDVPVVLPLHPRTRKRLDESGLLSLVTESATIQTLEPVSYLEMLCLEKHAKAIVTDSGGMQKEAYFCKVPCFTLRDETEWIETVETKWNTLVDPLERGSLKKSINDFAEPDYVMDLYGDGNAAEKIVGHLKSFLKSRGEK